MIHRQKKTTSMTVSSSQKLSEMRYENFYVMELREKWVSFYDVNWRRIMNVKIAMRQSVSNFSAMFLPNMNWFTAGKVIKKIKGWTFYRETVYVTLMLCYEYCELCCNMVLTCCFLKPLYCSQNYTVSHKTYHFVLDITLLNDLKLHNSPYFAFFTEFDCIAGPLCHSGWR